MTDVIVFTNVVNAHFTTNHPRDWYVEKVDKKLWGVCNRGGTILSVHPTKKAATSAIKDGPTRMRWDDTDAWYRGTNPDERNRALEPWERDIIRPYLNDPDY